MQINSPSSSRAAWYDRNPAIIQETYNANTVAPHTTTARWVYTVPSGRKALVEMFFVQAIRSTAAGTLGAQLGGIVLDAPTGTSYIQYREFFYDNTVWTNNTNVVTSSLALLAGNEFYSQTEDQSTGGDFNYVLTMKATEYDA